MLWMAHAGFGVWTLIGGTLVLRTTTTILVFAALKWRPDFYFRWQDVRSFLRFGLNVVGGRSLFFVFQKADVFIIGRVLGTQSVGFYSFAMQLASMPTDKIASIVNQVSFPIFARLQHDLREIQDVYLSTTKYLSILVAPLYLGGAIWGNEIVHSLLSDKWEPIILLFRAFCLAQLIISITVINSPVHTSMGRAHWVLYFYAASIPLMSAGIYISAHYGLNAVAIPWLTIYPLLCIAWTAVTLKKLEIPSLRYLRSSSINILASLLIVAGVEARARGDHHSGRQ